jgi:hypothetical protein
LKGANRHKACIAVAEKIFLVSENLMELSV